MFICTWDEVIDFLGAIHLNSKKRRFDSVSAGIGLLHSLSAGVLYKALRFQIKNFPVDHPSWAFSRANSFNFRVPMESKASELPKGLMLGRDGNIHIRLTGSTPLGNVRCYNPPPLGARRPRQQTFSRDHEAFWGLTSFGFHQNSEIKLVCARAIP
ncbi:hypothetical protein DVH24_026129 [Malus domestica]|uniref:Uncharacterized protein n=1 Tax=Malus domestica TaxID=3750 RepID=A0A498KNW7_MALDO|nr:hypothetical protein DVH24_026129 [Malus domestica]